MQRERRSRARRPARQHEIVDAGVEQRLRRRDVARAQRSRSRRTLGDAGDRERELGRRDHDIAIGGGEVLAAQLSRSAAAATCESPRRSSRRCSARRASSSGRAAARAASSQRSSRRNERSTDLRDRNRKPICSSSICQQSIGSANQVGGLADAPESCKHLKLLHLSTGACNCSMLASYLAFGGVAHAQCRHSHVASWSRPPGRLSRSHHLGGHARARSRRIQRHPGQRQPRRRHLVRDRRLAVDGRQADQPRRRTSRTSSTCSTRSRAVCRTSTSVSSTSDLGTTGADGMTAPASAAGPGGCSGTGKGGNLQTYGATLVTGNVSSATSTGRRRHAHDELHRHARRRVLRDRERRRQRLRLRAAHRGCQARAATDQHGERRLPAPRRVSSPSSSSPTKTTARWSTRTLLASDTAQLGPLQSFRCTRFGVTCDAGGATTDAMNQVGPKGSCHSNESGQYLTKIARLRHVLQGPQADDPTQRHRGRASSASTTPVETELRAPPGSTTAIPALAHSCTYTDSSERGRGRRPADSHQVSSSTRSRTAARSRRSASRTCPVGSR